MNHNITRRTGLKWVAAGATMGLVGPLRSAAARPAGTRNACAWDRTHDRVWLGGDFWANPMEDWRVRDGGAECANVAATRSVHSVTHQLTEPSEGFKMSVLMTQVEGGNGDGSGGFRIGIRSELNEYRSNCFVMSGLEAGVIGGRLKLGPESVPLSADLGKGVKLELAGASEGAQVRLTLKAVVDGKVLAEVNHTVAAGKLLGNVAVVSNFSAREAGKARFRFSGWEMGGGGFTVIPERRFGPILWSMYSLSDSRGEEGFVMKISALTGPMGVEDSQVVELHVEKDGGWKPLGEAKLDPDAWVATFRVPNWDEKTATPYKLVYREKHTDGTETPDEWTGIIRANPEGRPLRMAALTCQNDYAFPYEPVAKNVAAMDPDLVFFSGDQIYEGHGGYGIIREPAEPAILNYLRKFYQFGWSFREVMRNNPTLCLPDDHDVFHGNIWGEGGAPMKGANPSADSRGGYRQPARMVNAVHRTNVAHHPDPHDPEPSLQDISVYYGDMVYGGVGFAIIADRQWKSGPEHVETGGGRADHVSDPEFDMASLDKPGLVLLGGRQEDFLKKWAQDWRGHTLKAVLSQTVFAGVATHHGSYDGYLKGDLDAGAWPQTARNRAVGIIRQSKALHINGDQHLTSLSQYGTEQQRDSNWSFCTPAIAAGYPRWWRPDEVGMPHRNRPKHGHDHTGEYLDGFGNKVYVYAVGNPVEGKAPNRYDKAHEKGSGFGFVTFDTEGKTYTVESFRFLIDATDGKPGNQFPGWPVTIHQAENIGENLIG